MKKGQHLESQGQHLKFNLVELGSFARKVTSTQELLESQVTSILEIEPRREITLHDSLSLLWNSRGVCYDEITSQGFHVDGVGGEGSSPVSHNTTIELGCNLYKISNGLVFPAYNLLNVSDTSTAVERFAYSYSDCIRMLRMYSDFFQFDSKLSQFNFSYSERTKSLFEPAVQVETGQNIAILISNHEHDKVYTHWFAAGLYAIYKMLALTNNTSKPILIFSYKPLHWQLETIQFFFGTNYSVLIIDRPTLFRSVYIASACGHALCDGDYLRFLHSMHRHTVRPLTAKRLFITRNDTRNRQIINQHQVYSLLLRYGFTFITLGNLTFRDQVDTIAGATEIIFIAGSSGINFLFANNTCKVGIISFDDRIDPWKSILANYGIFNVNEIEATLVHNAGSMDLQVDIDRFSKFLEDFTK